MLYDAGVDPHETDRLGRLSLSTSGLRRRDELVLRRCVERGIPVASVIGGGYDVDHDALARRHALVVYAAIDVWKHARVRE